MTNPDIIKVGLGLASDFEKIFYTYPNFPPASNFAGVFDISDYDTKGL